MPDPSQSPDSPEGPGLPGRAERAGAGEIFLARAVAHSAYRWTIYAVLLLHATISLYYRVCRGERIQVLPWYGALLAIYFLALGYSSRDLRCRAVHFAFAVLVAAAFTREFFQNQARLVGAVEVAMSLLILAILAHLSGDEAFRRAGAVLESSPSGHEPDGTGHLD